ncbi:MAG: cytochrome c oxidase subunit 3 [Acetobacteraceae bacterium]|nr:cytochrome c oxidase subunit 3 [Acetobacteraceae bacterium]
MSSSARADGAVEFQFHDRDYQSGTALSGMWLFLSSELLFFGGLFLCWACYRIEYASAFAAATRETEFAIGTLNTVILLTSSFAFACAVHFARSGNNRRVVQLSAATALLGTLFFGLKLLEWSKDIAAGNVPGAHFRTPGQAGGEQLFWVFYWIGTGLHIAHLSVGIGLVGWIAWRARREAFGPGRATPVEIVGLYWSFVDMMWLILYPLIYLAGRSA